MAEYFNKFVSVVSEKLGPSGRLGDLVRSSKNMTDVVKRDVLSKLDNSDDYDNAEMWYDSDDSNGGKIYILVKTTRKLDMFSHKCTCEVHRYTMKIPM
jgi:hypothetical protein